MTWSSVAAEHFLSSTFRLSPRRVFFLLFFFFLSLLAATIEDAPITDLRLYQCNEERATHVEVNETVWSSFLNKDDHRACDVEIAIRCFNLLGGRRGERSWRWGGLLHCACDWAQQQQRTTGSLYFVQCGEEEKRRESWWSDWPYYSYRKGRKTAVTVKLHIVSCAVLANE